MTYFFRGIEDGMPMTWYGTVHIALLLFWLLGMASIVAYKKHISKYFKNDLLLKIFAGILLADQIILYSWQFGSGYFNWHMSLPLYHCRVGTVLIIIATFSNNTWAKAVGIYWAILGSLMAMLLPDMYLFKFPHYTNFQFFVVHILLGFMVMYTIAVQNYCFPKKDLKRVFIFSNIFNICVAAFNICMRPYFPSINYAFMYEVPPMLKSSLNFPLYIYLPVILLLYNVITFVIWCVGKRIYALQKKICK